MQLNQLKIAVSGLLMLIACRGLSQQSTGISGTVVDSVLQTPISFATIALLNQETKASVRGMQTDSSGHFVFENIPSGKYGLRITYVGYNIIFKENILINPKSANLNLGKLFMTASKSGLLKEVAITAKKEGLRNVDGKKVFLVDQSLVSKGGNAADLLQNVPTLQVDIYGNVSLRGSSNVKVLINGKPSIIANGDITQLLKSIPASAIENIEVIPNPPANYDADGEGIINIILKKNSKQGWNGSAEIAGGTNDNYNLNASLSYQSGKVNIYGNYSLKDGNTHTTGYQNYTFLQPSDSLKYTRETFPTVDRNKIQFVKAGIDYSLTPKATLGVTGSLNLRSVNENQFLSITNYTASNALFESYNLFNTVTNNNKTYEVDLDYTQRFKKPKEELTFNFSYAYGSFRDYQLYYTRFNPVNGVPLPDIDTPAINDTRHSSVNYNIQADYVLPVGKFGQLSAGYRTQITLGNNDQYTYSILNTLTTPLYKFTDFFSSNSQVNAIYVNYKDEIGKLSFQVGLRGEDSHLNASFLSYDANNMLFAAPVNVPVKGLYPSVLLTEKLENNSQLQFTFTNRLSKPTVRQLNSTTDFSDPTNYRTGNPGLIPASVTDLELDYTKTWQSITFTAGIYNNRVINVIKYIQSNPVDGETTTMPENIKYSNTTGLEFIGHFNVVKGWDIIANVNFFDRDNAAAPQYGIAANNGISWNSNITTNVTPLQNLSFQIHADYSAPYYQLQDRNRANYGLDAAAKYDFTGNRASLSFNANDIFNTRDHAILRSSDAIVIDEQVRQISSRATFTFSYRFGSGTSKHAKEVKRIEDAS